MADDDEVSLKLTTVVWEASLLGKSVVDFSR